MKINFFKYQLTICLTRRCNYRKFIYSRDYDPELPEYKNLGKEFPRINESGVSEYWDYPVLIVTGSIDSVRSKKKPRGSDQ
jgi:hypothetical protein